MRHLNVFLFVIWGIVCSAKMYAQEDKPVQTIRGVVVDYASGAPIAYATVGLLNMPHMGAATDNEGRFEIKHIPVGRHDL